MAFAISRAFWAPFWGPSGSMKPTVLAGDYFVTTPYTAGTIPNRGDVLVFTHPIDGTDFFKRVVGLPNEKIQMIDSFLHIDAVPVPGIKISDFEEVFGPQSTMRLTPRCSHKATMFGDTCINRNYARKAAI